jgi:hypothetical protein
LTLLNCSIVGNLPAVTNAGLLDHLAALDALTPGLAADGVFADAELAGDLRDAVAFGEKAHHLVDLFVGPNHC